MRWSGVLWFAACMLAGVAIVPWLRPNTHDAGDVRARHAAPSVGDLARAQTSRPRGVFRAPTPGQSTTALNAHLVRRWGAARTKACELWQPEELTAWTAAVLEVVDFGGEMQAVYTQRRDSRSLRLPTARAFADEWEREQSVLDARPDLRWLSTAGKCYEAVMLFTHHLTESQRERISSAGPVPLLPSHDVANNVAHALHQATAVGVQSSVHATVRDQVVCARCHLDPNVPIKPVQNSYLAPLPRPLLKQPREVVAQDGQLFVTLNVTTTRWEGPLSWNVRAYNGEIPGPTLRVSPGDTINVKLVNSLTGDVPDTPENLWRSPNVTNIHFHGLWIPPQDVFSGALPGSTLRRSFQLSADHAPGTNWYHPHYHGSVSLQLASGMSGVVVVEDPPGTIDDSLRDLPELVLVLQSIEIFNYTSLDIDCPLTNDHSRCHGLDGAGSVLTMRHFSGDKMPMQLEVNDPLAGNPISGNYFTVNAQFQPQHNVLSGEFQRWRFLNAAHQQAVSLALPGCDFQLIAMDGVYLASARPKNRTSPLVVPPGSRADVIVSCTATPTNQTFFLESRENPDTYTMGVQTGFNSGILMLVNVSNAAKPQKPPLGAGSAGAIHGPSPAGRGAPVTTAPNLTTLPKPPAYLQDLRAVPRSEVNTTVIEFDLLYLINNTAGLTDVPVYGINGRAFNLSRTPDCIPFEGMVQEFVVRNPIWLCNASQPLCEQSYNRSYTSAVYQRRIFVSHGFHLHTFKFQVVNATAGDGLDFDFGDWRDTAMTPPAGDMVVRWAPNHFQGLVPFHCHTSPHSDRGMLATVTVSPACPAP